MVPCHIPNCKTYLTMEKHFVQICSIHQVVGSYYVYTINKQLWSLEVDQDHLLQRVSGQLFLFAPKQNYSVHPCIPDCVVLNWFKWTKHQRPKVVFISSVSLFHLVVIYGLFIILVCLFIDMLFIMLFHPECLLSFSKQDIWRWGCNFKYFL